VIAVVTGDVVTGGGEGLVRPPVPPPAGSYRPPAHLLVIEHAGHRARAIDIGERLEVLKNYPTPPNCTSPFAPVWITEMVRRQQDQ
jgi:hypothetical protein